MNLKSCLGIRPCGGDRRKAEEHDMIKVFSLLKGREDWTRDEFQRWWIEEHVPSPRRASRRVGASLTRPGFVTIE